jgi:hypothetical protein
MSSEMRAALEIHRDQSRTIPRGDEPRTAVPVMRTRTDGFGIRQARDQAARKPVRGSYRGPAGAPNTIEVRERARAQGIEVKTAAGYPPT